MSSPGPRGSKVRRAWHFILLASLFTVIRARAASPTLEYIFPIALAHGSKEIITVGGKFDPWPVSVWVDCPGLTFSPTTNSGKINVEISAEAPIGPHLLRIYNSDGASSPRIFVITTNPDTVEKEPNNSITQAQSIAKLPATISGRLEKSGDVDFYSINLEAGKWFVASVDAFSLGSPVDAAVQLRDADGVRVAFCHDDGPRLDPVLAYKVEKAGVYFLEIAGFVNPPAADIRYAGSPATIYRLALTQDAFIKHLFPAGVRRGQKTVLQYLGWNLDGVTSREVESLSADSGDQTTYVSVKTPENCIPIAVSDLEEIVEKEPNNSGTNAQSISGPCVVNGLIAPPGDEDRFQFAAKKGERISLRVESASLGFSLDPLLRIEDSAGHQLAPEDRGSVESKLEWTALTNGNYIAVIGDLFHRGGDDYGYRLAFGPARPDFRGIALQDSIRLVPGETNEFKIEVTRLNSYTNALALVVADLPKGVVVKLPDIPAKSGEVTVPFVASAEASPTNRPISISVRSTTGDGPKTHAVIYDLKGKEAVGGRLINETAQIWLTIVPKPPPAPVKPPEKK